MPIRERREELPKPPAGAPLNRFALVIGCDNYKDGSKLSKAVNDAEDMHALLKRAGFQSTLVCDATYEDMVLQKQALIDVVRGYTGSDPPIVCVFFSGHGADKDKGTHLLCVDKSGLGGLEVDPLLADLNRVAKGMTLLLLTDACRADSANTTFKTRAVGDVQITPADWQVMLGVPGAEPPSFKVRGSTNTQLDRDNRFFLGYACKPGTVALEGASQRNGYFTKALLQHLATPGRTVLDAFVEVVEDVKQWTSNRQGPWMEGDMPSRLLLFPRTLNVSVPPHDQPASPHPLTPSPNVLPADTVEEGMDIHTAAEKGNADVIRKLLVRGVDVNAVTKTEERATALHIAARNKQLRVVQDLIDAGANIHAKARFDITPILDASGATDNALVVKLLLNHGARLSDKCNLERTPFLSAASLGFVGTTIMLLLDCGADIHATDHNGRTALHLAADSGKCRELIELLVKKGVDIRAKDKAGLTALDVAKASDKPDQTAIEFLAKAMSGPAPTSGVNGKTDTANVPSKLNEDLYLAAGKGRFDEVQRLLNAGADVDSTHFESDWTALHNAASDGYVDVVKLLLSRGADVKAKTKKGNTAMKLARDEGHQHVVRVLDVLTVSLQDAVSDSNTDLVKRLLDMKHTKVDSVDEDCWTPLHFAASNGNTEIVRLLVDKGANVNAKTKKGWTPLHWAVRAKSVDTARLLLERGADREAESEAGNTAKDIARQDGNTDMFGGLLA